VNEWLWFFGKVGVVLGIIFTFAPLMTLMERKVSAWVQMRHGPNRVGPQGLLQPVADLVKLVMKELIIPGKTDRALFFMGPVLAFIPPTLAFCVIPLATRSAIRSCRWRTSTSGSCS
jgi:NADH-quinone oxidoreductase subunit H